MTCLFGEGNNSGRFIHGAGPKTDDGDRDEARIQQGAAAIKRPEYPLLRRHSRPGASDPAVGLLHFRQHVERQQHRGSSTEEHGAPTESCADSKVQRRGKEESDVVTRLQVAGAHLAPRFGPDFGNVGAGQGPLATDAYTGEKPENTQLPHVLRQCCRGGEQRITGDGGGEGSGAPPTIGEGTPDERSAPPGEKHRE